MHYDINGHNVIAADRASNQGFQVGLYLGHYIIVWELNLASVSLRKMEATLVLRNMLLNLWENKLIINWETLARNYENRKKLHESC